MARQKKESHEIKQTRAVSVYDGNTPARFGEEMFLMNKWQWDLNFHEFKLFLMLCQEANKVKTEDFEFTRFDFDVKTVFKHLGLQNRNDDYSVLIDALDSFLGKTIKMRDDAKRRFKGYNLCWMAEMDEGKVSFGLSPIAVPLMKEFTRYALIRPANVAKLSSSYQQQLYALFRSKIDGKTHRGSSTVKMSDLLQYLNLEKTATYQKDKNRNYKMDFCRNVLGIVRPKGWRYIVGKELEGWTYWIRDGKETGSLYHINTTTDLEVSAYAYDYDKEVWLHFSIIENKAKDAANKPRKMAVEGLIDWQDTPDERAEVVKNLTGKLSTWWSGCSEAWQIISGIEFPETFKRKEQYLLILAKLYHPQNRSIIVPLLTEFAKDEHNCAAWCRWVKENLATQPLPFLPQKHTALFVACMTKAGKGDDPINASALPKIAQAIVEAGRAAEALNTFAEAVDAVGPNATSAVGVVISKIKSYKS